MAVLGVDVGGVIIQRSDEDADTSFFGDNFLLTPPVPDVFEALARLNRQLFAGRVYVVSKCGEETEDRTRAWLEHHDFHNRTGIPVDHLRFCRTRPAKAPIAVELGLTHFVDDRLEVLSYLTTVPYRYLLRPSEAEVREHAAHLPAVRRVQTWPQVVDDMATTLG